MPFSLVWWEPVCWRNVVSVSSTLTTHWLPSSPYLSLLSNREIVNLILCIFCLLLTSHYVLLFSCSHTLIVLSYLFLSTLVLLQPLSEKLLCYVHCFFIKPKLRELRKVVVTIKIHTATSGDLSPLQLCSLFW